MKPQETLLSVRQRFSDGKAALRRSQTNESLPGQSPDQPERAIRLVRSKPGEGRPTGARRSSETKALMTNNPTPGYDLSLGNVRAVISEKSRSQQGEQSYRVDFFSTHAKSDGSLTTCQEFQPQDVPDLLRVIEEARNTIKQVREAHAQEQRKQHGVSCRVRQAL